MAAPRVSGNRDERLPVGFAEVQAADPLRVGIASLGGMVAHFDWVRVLTR